MFPPKISIIVPVYNVEQYLPMCIESILSQTFTDFELLLIDDGTPDSSGDICDEYARKDSRIRVFHKDNGGVSSARNLGLDEMRGEWVTFVDADDWIGSSRFESVVKKISDKVNILVTSYTRCSQTNDLKILPFDEGLYNAVQIREDILPHYLGRKTDELKMPILLASVCTCFFRRELINEIRFDKIKIMEDKLFFVESLLNSNHLYISNDTGYFYRLNSVSACKSYNSTMFEDIEFTVNKLNNLLSEYNLLEQFKEQLNNTMFIYLYMICLNESYTEKSDICRIIKFRKRYCENLFEKLIPFVQFNKLYFLLFFRLYALFIFMQKNKN